ncbi:MAG TPA: ATP-binding protein [Thermomicrobiales bacterium]|nr:ATP-binding protein [Thermomicrobiales bacterium]
MQPQLTALPPRAASPPAAPADRDAPSRLAASGEAKPAWTLKLPLAVAALIVAWAAVALAFDQAQLNIPAPRAQLGAEAAVASITFFCAVVLILFVAEGIGQRRLRWVAGGFVIQAIGSGVFGYLMPLFDRSPNLNTSLYTALLVLVCADTLFVIGLMPDSPPRFTAGRFLAVLIAFAGLAALTVLNGARLSPLVTPAGASVADGGILTWTELTRLHLLLAAIPLALAVAAAAAVAYHARTDGMGAWLVLAMVVYAGSHLHQMFWPATFHMNLTSSGALRLAAAGILAIGGMIELKRAAGERADLLQAEQEYSLRLAELAKRRADFMAMVAHELDSPIAAIRAWADLLETDRMSPAVRTQGLETIRIETKLLQGLVADVTAVATIDRDDFTVQLRPTLVVELLSAASDLNRALPGGHPLTLTIDPVDFVRADPERIGQVLRNLLSNATKYTPPGSPIELRAIRDGDRVRFDVVDHGPGIAPGDEERIFEKFERGSAQPNGARGVGLGLYLSRRILLAHRSDLTVEPTPGGGATFSFTLGSVS